MESPRPLKPRFLITVDTEGDNIWSLPRTIETRNTAFLPRFQRLCEKYRFKPTGLTNYEMASDPAFIEFGRDAVRRGAAEIGMHLHAWNSPPIVPLTSDDFGNQPFLIEYPAELMHRKVAYLTGMLEDAFGSKMTSHRAGRWAFDANYARILADSGYLTDCSVTPFVSWKSHPGDPAGAGGPDYIGFPDSAYFLDLDDIGRAGDSELLELPMSIREQMKPLGKLAGPGLARKLSKARIVGRFFSRTTWLRPNGSNLPDMLELLSRSRMEGRPYVEFMLHSSELMPGGSPYFPGNEDLETLYRDMEALFAEAARDFEGSTLQEYRLTFKRAAA